MLTNRLYNKEAVLNFLLNRETLTESQQKSVAHIRGLKDITELNLTPNGSDEVAGTNAKFACPVTGLTMNGSYRCVCVCVLGSLITIVIATAQCSHE